jgi:hypothetical protein
MTVRAKLQLTKVTHTLGGARELTFEARYDDKIPEDQRFQKATPWGQLTMTVDNPAALAQFMIGDHYYLDFKRVPREEPAPVATE